MSGYLILGLVVVLLVLFGIYLSATAGRLDRLHHRVDTAYQSLDVQLLRRSGAAFDVATSGLLDPASSLVLADAALAAKEDERDPIGRAQHESDLTKVVAATIGSREDVDALFSDPQGKRLGEVLSGALHRTALSRRFYNDAVRACRAVRRQRMVRLFRLAGSAPWPRTVEMDDDVPPGFAGR